MMLDGIGALQRMNDLNGWTNADAVDDTRNASALLVATFRPNVVVFVLFPVDLADIVAGTFPDGTTMARLGDLDRIGTTG